MSRWFHFKPNTSDADAKTACGQSIAWRNVSNADRVTCPRCRARLAAAAPPHRDRTTLSQKLAHQGPDVKPELVATIRVSGGKLDGKEVVVVRHPEKLHEVPMPDEVHGNPLSKKGTPTPRLPND